MGFTRDFDIFLYLRENEEEVYTILFPSPLFLSPIIRIGADWEDDTSIRDLSLEAGHLNVLKNMWLLRDTKEGTLSNEKTFCFKVKEK